VAIDESRRTSWTEAEIAVAYDRGRPSYPAEAVRFALEPLRGRPDLRALDVGAGTGKLTQVLCAAGVPTVAVEPAPGMLKVLKHAVSRAQVLAGSAEELPLPDAAVDLVAVGQAFHWFDPDRALPEMARVLRPGGRLALFYNSRDDSVAWVSALADLVGDHADHAGAHREQDPEVLGRFVPEQLGRFRHEQELDADGLAELVGSRSYVIRMAPDERAELLNRVRTLARTHPQLVGRQHFFMPYVTSVQRYTLRS
jgi:ubiquinone/menaquinone biosynthesis C-methylase UbiE